MPAGKIKKSIKKSVHGAVKTVHQGFSAIGSDLSIAVYPLFVFLLVIASLAFVNGAIVAATTWLANEPIFEPEQHMAKVIFGLVALLITYLYLAIVMGVFTCVISASVIYQLNGHKAPLLGGSKYVLKNFFRVIKFSALSILFIPFGFIAQRHKAGRSPHEVLGSSFSLGMAQLAPAILTSEKGVMPTIRHSVNTMGEGWKENVVIKSGVYGLIIFLGAASFLPKLAEDYWIDDSTAETVGWIVSILLFLTLLMVTKVLGSVFTTTLYWRITTKRHK